jgi:hypothetical protein
MNQVNLRASNCKNNCSKIEHISHAGVAQLVEQLIRNQQVAGSSPVASSKQIKAVLLLFKYA